LILSRLLRIWLNPGIYAGVLLAGILMIGAYQFRPAYDIPFGTQIDGVLLDGFHAEEKAPDDQTFRFRWSSGDAYITLQDVGRQDFDVALSVSGTRPAGQPSPSIEVRAGGKSLLKVAPPPQLTAYSFQVPRESVEDGTLRLHLTANAFSPPGDERELGVLVTHLRVTPSANPDRFIEPPLGPLVWVLGAIAMLGLVLAALGWGVGGVALGTCIVGVFAAWLLVADRLWLTSRQWYEAWPQVLLAGAVLLLLFRPVSGWLLRSGGADWTAIQRRVFLTVLFAAFVVRLAGQLHPQIYVVDLGFHEHRFQTVESGQLLFLTFSSEWGNRHNFYLPTAYVFMLPLQWLLHDERLIIRIFTCAISTLGAFAVFYLVKRVVRSGWAALSASVLYLSMPISVIPLSWGVTTNVFGEFFAVCALAIAVGAYPNLRPNRLAVWALLFVFFIALLSHPGVVLLTGLTFGLMSLIWLASRRMAGRKAQAAWLLGTLLAATLLAFIFYYSHFVQHMLTTFEDIRREQAAEAQEGGLHLLIGGSVSDRSLGLVVRYVETRREWLFGGLRGFWQEAQAYYRVWPLVGALLGYLLVWPAGRKGLTLLRENARSRLALAALAWMLAVAVFALIGWTMNLYVRYMLFALPAITIGAGILASGMRRAGRWGVVLSLLLVAYFVVEMLALWHYRINYALK
jgi:hypothetical protein